MQKTIFYFYIRSYEVRMTLKIKFDINDMKIMSMFESLTGVSPRDCISEDNRIIFVVNQGDIAKAIGKKGINIRKLENIFKKKMKVVEYNPEMLIFVQNVFAPLKVADIVHEEQKIIITPPDSKTREMMIGRAGMNLRGFEAIVKRYFEIDEIRVV